MSHGSTTFRALPDFTQLYHPVGKGLDGSCLQTHWQEVWGCMRIRHTSFCHRKGTIEWGVKPLGRAGGSVFSRQYWGGGRFGYPGRGIRRDQRGGTASAATPS